MAMNGNRAASGNGNDSVSCSVATAGTGTVARADDLIGMGGAYAADPQIWLTRVLSDLIGRALLAPLMRDGLLDPPTLFDAFTRGSGIASNSSAADAFDVVGYPGQMLGTPLCGGDICLRRALGEPSLGHAAIIASADAYPRKEALARGFILEGGPSGLYAPVVEAGLHPHPSAHGFSRRMTNADGRLSRDTWNSARPRLREVYTAEKTPPATTPVLTLDVLKIGGIPRHRADRHGRRSF